MKTIIGIIVALIIIAGGWYWYTTMQAPAAQTPAPADTSTPADTNGAAVSDGVTASTAPMSATVVYTSSGFTPATVTIAKGGQVTFVNQSGNPMWVASDPHPTHTAYDGTSRTTHCAPGYTGATPFDQCANTNSYSFTFEKTGTFGYHNHLGADDAATIIVQ